jgi:hypothetical protein
MRLPRNGVVYPERVPAPPRVGAPVGAAQNALGVQPSINIGCVLSTAAGCLFQCGLDVNCLLSCAPGLAKCL